MGAVAVAAAAGPDRRDRVGLGWRPALAADILIAQERIDLLEVVADNWFRCGRRDRAMLRSMARQIPLSLHGVSMGLASAIPAVPARIDAMARLVGAIEPESWSEHLAFVRAGSIEIGHLCAPPRNAATIEGALRNIERAACTVGQRPLLENVATLIEPPLSTLDETEWIALVLHGAGAPLLLDLHNLHANAVNGGRDPLQMLLGLPLERVGLVHLSGGCFETDAHGERRLVDDHVHDVPDAVYLLLERLALETAQPLDVVIERDGRFPRFDVLLQQIDRAREALARGRRARRRALGQDAVEAAA